MRAVGVATVKDAGEDEQAARPCSRGSSGRWSARSERSDRTRLKVPASTYNTRPVTPWQPPPSPPLRETRLRPPAARGDLKAVLDELRAGDVVELDLQNWSLGGGRDARDLGLALGRSARLRTLVLPSAGLGGNAFAALSQALRNLPHLQELDLSCNALGREGMKVLAGGLQTQKGLKTLRLRSVGLGDHGVQELATTLPMLQNLRSLSVRNNDCNLAGVAALSKTFAALTALRVLDLGNNRLCKPSPGKSQQPSSSSSTDAKGGKKGGKNLPVKGKGKNNAEAIVQADLTNSPFSSFIKALEKLPGLEILDIGDNALGTAGVDVLCSGFKHMLNLKLLSIRGNQAGNPEVLAKELGNLRNLQVLDISDNQLSGEAWPLLCQACAGLSQLAVLEVERNLLGPEGTVQLSAVLPKLAPSLLKLNLAGTEPGREGVKELAQGLCSLTLLNTLNLSNNKLATFGMKILADSFRRLPRLQALHLSNNQMAAAGMKALIPVLNSVPSLTVLDVGSNLLGDAGAIALAASLKVVHKLETLNVFGLAAQLEQVSLRWHSRCMMALGESLPVLRHLHTLNLAHNSFGEEGSQTLAALLGRLEGLRALNLGNCCFREADMRRVAAPLESLQLLERLDADHMGSSPLMG